LTYHPAARERGRDSTSGVLCHGSSILNCVDCYDVELLEAETKKEKERGVEN
jgi:hypothetical protein